MNKKIKKVVLRIFEFFRTNKLNVNKLKIVASTLNKLLRPEILHFSYFKFELLKNCTR